MGTTVELEMRLCLAMPQCSRKRRLWRISSALGVTAAKMTAANVMQIGLGIIDPPTVAQVIVGPVMAFASQIRIGDRAVR